jgi:simple sugar transport system substrate-binding protein
VASISSSPTVKGKQENQIAPVRSFITQGVDAIVIAPIVATGWDPGTA